MTFAHPWWLGFAFAALIAMPWAWHRFDLRQRRALGRFVAPHLHANLTQTLSGRRRALKRALSIGAVVLAFVALAGPQAGYRWETLTQRGNHIMFAVDTSRSMSTPDVKPTRLGRAKLAIDSFVDRLNGDAVGLIAFAGSAFVQTPLTVDYGAFRESLAALDVGIVPRGGTDITSAIQAAQQALRARPGSDKILILVTDGEDLEGDSLAAARTAAHRDGLKIYTVGVGSANGDLIPLPSDEGGGFLRDREGRFVKSHLDERTLKALAAATGGIYAPLGADNRGLDTIYESAMAPLAKHAVESRAQKLYTQRFQWPLGAAIFMLLASLAVNTRRAPAARKAAGTTDTALQREGTGFVAVPSLVACLAVAGFLHAPSVQAASASPAAAAAAYAHGDYAAAASDYAAAAARAPRQPLLQYDAGAAAYKAGSYAEAAHAFQASVDTAQSGSAKRLRDQEDAYYNLGNALYREGETTRQDDAQRTVTAWTKSLKAYDAALELRPDDTDGKFNRDLVQRKLDALKQKQQQRPQQGQSQSNPAPAGTGARTPTQQNQAGQHQGSQDQSRQSVSPSRQGVSPAQASSPAPQPGTRRPPTAGAQPAPAGNRGGGTPRAAGASSPGAQLAENTDDQRAPGGMSREEARELLDSVNDAKPLPPAAPNALNSTGAAPADEPLKDW